MANSNLAYANYKITKEGIPLELVRGEGYHYFVFDDGKHFETVSVMVPYTNSLSYDQWLAEARAAWRTIKDQIA